MRIKFSLLTVLILILVVTGAFAAEPTSANDAVRQRLARVGSNDVGTKLPNGLYYTPWQGVLAVTDSGFTFAMSCGGGGVSTPVVIGSDGHFSMPGMYTALKGVVLVPSSDFYKPQPPRTMTFYFSGFMDGTTLYLYASPELPTEPLTKTNTYPFFLVSNDTTYSNWPHLPPCE